MTRRGVLFAALAGTLVCVVLVGLLGAAEFALRSRERDRDTVPGSMESIFYVHNRLRHALIRDNEYYGWVRVNDLGLRGGPVSLEKPAGTFRILAVGASTTFDSYVSADSLAWPSLLQQRLRTLRPDMKVEVLNAGVPGYVVLDNSIRLQTELHRFQPDLVILYEGHNNLFGAIRFGDPLPAAGEKRPGEVPTITPWGRWLASHSLLYSKVSFLLSVRRWRTSNAGGDGEQAGRDSVRVLEGAARFQRDLALFVQVAREFGIPVVLPEMVQVSGERTDSIPPQVAAMWRRSTGAVHATTVVQAYQHYNAAIATVAGRFALTHIPTRGFGLTGEEWYAPDDPIHFNDRGAARWADSLAAALVTKRALPPPPSLPQQR